MAELLKNYVPAQRVISSFIGKWQIDTIGNLEDDILQWIDDGDRLIDTKLSLEPVEHNVTVENGAAALCPGMRSIICVSDSFGMMNQITDTGCDSTIFTNDCTCDCSAWNYTEKGFYLQNCFIKFKGVDDGAVIHIKGQKVPSDKDGVPMVPEPHVNALSEYVGWMYWRMKRSYNDAVLCERRWKELCVIARAKDGEATANAKAKIGRILSGSGRLRRVR